MLLGSWNMEQPSKRGEIKSNMTEEFLQDVLDYIEEESESWDEEKLAENGIIDAAQLILEASCKKIFIDAYQDMEEEYPILRLSEKTLYDQSKFFYRDCLCSLIKQSLPESNEEIKFDEFYVIFIEFIKSIREIKIEEDMQDELWQLIELLEKVYFTSEDKYNLDKKNPQELFRYVKKKEEKEDEDKDKEIDVKIQTKRFWRTWIVEESPKDISKAALEKKNMKKQELFIWLLLAAIYNFAECFGDCELKEFRECILHFRKKNEKDISPILKWCFECFNAIKSSDKNYQIINEKDYSLGLQGIFSLMERFHYVHFTVKKAIKEEMEYCWKQDEKKFISQLAFDAWTQIKIDTIETSKNLVKGWVEEYKKKSRVKENNDEEQSKYEYRLSRKEFLVRDVKNIWKDISTDYLYFDPPNEYSKESCDRDGQTEEWELGLDLFEKIWCNDNFECIKEYYINKVENGSMTEAEFESALKPIWEFAWELFEAIWVYKDMQNDSERISVDEFKSAMEYNWKRTYETSKLMTDEDIEELKKEYKKTHGNILSDTEFSNVLASELGKLIELNEKELNHQVNFFTAYIVTTLIEKISSNHWKYGLLSVKHIVFAKMYILISELSDDDVEEWIEKDFQNVDSECHAVILVINSLLEEYSENYKMHEDLMSIWMHVVKIILNSKEFNALPLTAEFLYELFIDSILHESDYLV